MEVAGSAEEGTSGSEGEGEGEGEVGEGGLRIYGRGKEGGAGN